MANRSATVLEVRAALAVLESSGARAAVEARIGELTQAALRELQTGVSRQGVSLLVGAAEALTARRS